MSLSASEQVSLVCLIVIFVGFVGGLVAYAYVTRNKRRVPGPFTLLGVSGKFGVGKTTFVNILLEELPGRWIVLNFADALKEVAAILCVSTKEDMYTTEGKNLSRPSLGGKTSAQLQQILGDGLRKSVDPNIWVRIAMGRADEACRKDPDVRGIIFGDARYPTEVDAIMKERGGLMVRLNRACVDAACAGGRSKTDNSETALDDFDGFTRVIQNDSQDLNALRAHARDFVRAHFHSL